MKILLKRKHIYDIVKSLFILFIFITLIIITITIWRETAETWQFRPLPHGALNGYWALTAVESDHPRFANNIFDLTEKSFLVLRVRVINERVEVFGGGDTTLFWEQFYVYELEVQEAFKNFVLSYNALEQGDLIEIIQFRALARDSHSPYYPPINNYNKRQYFDLIQSDINVDDDLIIFLINHHDFLRDFYSPEPTLFARLRHAHEHVNGRMVRNGYIERDIIARRIRGGNPTPSNFFTLTNQVQATFLYCLNSNIFTGVNPVNNLILTRECLYHIKYSN
ncbi:MAG: hypothetical protein FWB87_14800 [Defluviitaleaceae bacterium]|nr:hypothetical protein [Defluviitaleaceae bacterium]